MGDTSFLAPEQLGALARLKAFADAEGRVGSVPIDIVRYPYATLDEPSAGPAGVAAAGLRDLAAMKLAAIARRGIRRDFWDVYALAQNGFSLDLALTAYRAKFGVREADLYHVLRALTYFDDADADTVPPAGMTPELWQEIVRHFTREVPRVAKTLVADV